MFALQMRESPSKLMIWLSPVIALVLTLLLCPIIFAVLGKDPWQGFTVFFLNPLKSTYSLGEIMLLATPLTLIGLGLSIGFRSNVWNIGAEGQYLVGAAAATWVAISTAPMGGGLSLLLMMLAAIMGGMIWAAIPAFLRCHFNANEILVSLMLVYVADLMISWLVQTPWRDPAGFNFPQTVIFDDKFMIPVLFQGLRVTWVFPMALVMLGVAYLFMRHSYLGFQMRVAGQSEAAARYAGYSLNKTIWVGMLSGGAMAGLAGMAEIAGPLGQLTDKISVGYGFTAIIVAFIGRLHPIGILLGSFLMAVFSLGGEQAQQYLGLPSSIAKAFQGMLLLLLLGCDVLINWRVTRR